ncbi:hypothetical protein NJ7G_0945 [Natrinema sp. J7-2]|nr:hypothetical protein NJ7G_0945 [Natrinema sp. J7-2]
MGFVKLFYWVKDVLELASPLHITAHLLARRLYDQCVPRFSRPPRIGIPRAACVRPPSHVRRGVPTPCPLLSRGQPPLSRRRNPQSRDRFERYCGFGVSLKTPPTERYYATA